MLMHTCCCTFVSVLVGFKLKLKLNSNPFENSFGKIQFLEKEKRKSLTLSLFSASRPFRPAGLTPAQLHPQPASFTRRPSTALTGLAPRPNQPARWRASSLLLSVADCEDPFLSLSLMHLARMLVPPSPSRTGVRLCSGAKSRSRALLSRIQSNPHA